MAKKKWSIPEIKERASRFHHLRHTNIQAFIKKVLGAEKKRDYTSGEKEARDEGMEFFNRVFQTNYKFVWKLIGEADLYERADIISSTQKEEKFLEENGQQRLQF